MKLRTLASLAVSGRLSLLRSIAGFSEPFYRVSFLGVAAAEGVLAKLASGPLPLDGIAGALGLPEPLDARAREGLRAWLDVGVTLGELRSGPEGYSLRGRLARRLADPANDDGAAFFEEIATVHHALIAATPARLRRGVRFALAETPGEIPARSSRLLEPWVNEAIDRAVASTGPIRVFEVGCGSAHLLRYAASRNPELTAVGLEREPAVAAAARENVRKWGLEARIAIEEGDLRDRAPDPAFDLATLHNIVSYVPVEARVDLFRHVRGFLRPGGRVLATTGCRGGTVGFEVLNLWAAMTEGCGCLPFPADLEAQLREAGFEEVESRNLVGKFDSFYAFSGRRPLE